MTREEFMRGWTLLTLQPWGRMYDGKLEPEKSQLQFELYYSQLAFGHAEAWKPIATLYASGSSWPALDEIRRSLSERSRSLHAALPAPATSHDIDNHAQQEAEAILSRIMGKPFKFPV